MKIALLTDGIYPYVMGGMQKHSYYLAKYLAQNKIEVLLFHLSAKNNLDAQKLECFTDEEKKFIKATVIDFPTLDKLPGHYIRESYKHSEIIYKELESELSSIDFIYAKGFCAWHLLVLKSKGKKFPPIGVNFHGYEMFQRNADLKSFIKSKLFTTPVKYNVHNADCVFSYGAKITNIIEDIGVSRNKIIEIPTGIDAAWISNAPTVNNSIIRFVFVGRYERRKGIKELSAVIKDLQSKLNFEFHFIGPIPDAEKIVSKKIIYHGSIIEQEKIKSILSTCDVLVCPSYSEGMPNVILEAMSCGLAIIASDVGAVSRLVSNETGWLIPSANKDALTKAMQEAISISKEELLAKKKNAIELIRKNFTWESVINTTIAEIKKRI